MISQSVGGERGLDRIDAFIRELRQGVSRHRDYIPVVAKTPLQGVDGPCPPDQNIVSGQAQQGVGTQATREHIGVGIADQKIVERRAGQILETCQGIRAAIAVVGRDAAVQLSRHSRRRRAVVHGVDARAAGQPVGARAPREDVVERRARQIFDPGQHIAGCLAGAAGLAA